MRVLFQPVYLETPHFETELELMADHVAAGDEVFVLTCHGELATCFANPSHDTSWCARCQARCARGLDVIGPQARRVRYPGTMPPRPEIPPVFDDFDALAAFRVGAARVGLAAASSLCSRFGGEHRVDTVRRHQEVAAEVHTALYVYTSVRRALLDLKPDRMYVFNGRFSTALPAIDACMELGVAYATHERGGDRDRYWVVPNTTPHDIGHARLEIDALWSSHAEADGPREAAAFFTDRRQGAEQAWYSYTTAQRAGTLPDGFDRHKRNIAIFNSTVEEFVAVRPGPHVLVYADEIEAVGAICSAFADDPSFHVYLRLHPHLKGRDTSQTQALRAMDGRFANLTLVSADSAVDSYALMDRSHAVVTFGSTMGVEACFWNKPSILLGRAYYEDLDCAYRPATHDEVVALLRADLLPHAKTGAMKYGFWERALGVPFKHYAPESLTRGTFKGVRIADAVPATEAVRDPTSPVFVDLPTGPDAIVDSARFSRVFERCRDSLTGAQPWQAWRDWKRRREGS